MIDGPKETAQVAMRRFVADALRPAFQARGFKSRALTFFRNYEDNFALVQLQKSSSSTASSVDFTLNLAVFSARVHETLARYLPEPEVSGVPTESACHLRIRVGELLPDRGDIWWTVRANAPYDTLGARIREVLERHAFPLLDATISDEGLRDHWFAHPPRGADALALAVLVRELGPRERLGPLLDQLRAETPVRALLLWGAVQRFAADTGA